MKFYYLDTNGLCIIVAAKTKRDARKMLQGDIAWNYVTEFRLATEDEIIWYEAMGGIKRERMLQEAEFFYAYQERKSQ